ncbi:hypothetical protein [Streptomyces cremeus]|uniref:Uncharacterized protein n=1 Tax=Streptomyces cremeus TaxID=66881 RepID=A0ABV5PHQ5_STRCM
MLDARNQGPGGAAGSVEFALLGGLLEELVRFVATGLRIGEDCGESRPVLVGEDAFGVVGDSSADVAGKGAAGLFARLAALQVGEHWNKGVVGGGLEVAKGLAGCVGLVSAVPRLVPALSEDRCPDQGGEQGGKHAAVRAGGGVDDVAGRGAYSVARAVFGTNPGALGTDKHL